MGVHRAPRHERRRRAGWAFQAWKHNAPHTGTYGWYCERRWWGGYRWASTRGDGRPPWEGHAWSLTQAKARAWEAAGMPLPPA